MKLAEIRKIIEQSADLPSSEIDFFLQSLQSVKLSKGDFFLRPDEPCDRLNFVQEGLLRLYTIDENGEELTESFIESGEMVSDYKSMILKRVSKIFIEALDDSIVWRSTVGLSETLHRRNLLWYAVGLSITQKLYLKQAQHIEQLTRMKALERYIAFKSQYHQVIHLIPKKDIACYLGITKESLSRLTSDN